jgi:hypothetical protein
MSQPGIQILRTPIDRKQLSSLAAEQFGDMIKATVDVTRELIALGGELHSDEEALLLDDGSSQADLWGINLYPAQTGDGWVEFDSMINLRPSQGNRSRSVESEALRDRIRAVVARWITG